MDTNELRHLIAATIDRLGGDSFAQRFSRDGWNLERGSARGMIGIVPDEADPGASGILVAFQIMHVPTSHLERFCRVLLGLNFRLAGTASFAIDDSDTVWLLTGRKAEGISAEELQTLVYETSRAADHFDDELLEEFGSPDAASDSAS